MSKRFTDTEKWSRMNFRKMSPATKLFWIYILDRCDHAGVWCVDLEAAEFFIGMKLDEKKLLGEMNGNVVVLNDSKKWFVVDFIRFQYGETLNPNNKLHNSVINLLRAYGIDYENIEALKQAPTKPLDSPFLGVKDKDKDKDKEKPYLNFDGFDLVKLTQKEYDTLLSQNGKNIVDACIKKLHFYKLSSGKTYKSDYGAINSWVLNEVKEEVKKQQPTSYTPEYVRL